MSCVKSSQKASIIVLVLLIVMLVGCTAGEEAEPEPIIYGTLDELLEAELYDNAPGGTVLEGTVTYQDYVIGILFNSEQLGDSFYQFFYALESEDGYLLDTVSVKLRAENDYGFSLESDQGDFTVHFAMGQAELSSDVLFLDSIAISNGKKIDVGISPVI